MGALMSDPTGDGRDWSLDLLIGGAGMFLGFLFALTWNKLPAVPDIEAVGGSVFLLVCFMVAHSTDDPITAFMGHAGQLIVGCTEGVLIACSLLGTQP